MSVDSPDLRQVLVPENLGVRLGQVFGLKGTPTTVDELAKYVGATWSKTLRNPSMNQRFRAISSGTEVFGHVDYDTGHKVIPANGKEVFTACALDALIEGFFQPIQIESKCFHCDQPIRLAMSGGSVGLAEPTSMVVWLGSSAGTGCSCEADVCSHINFFASDSHASEWKTLNPAELGMVLTLQESLELARRGWWEPVRQVLQGSEILTGIDSTAFRQ